jgi:two-component system, chemotaxis family, chemotaxis protein CheY
MSMRILVVDDSATMRNITARTLKEIGYQSYSLCECPLAALDLLKKEEFDLILLDWYMPKMNGLDMLRHVRTSMQKNIPIIMLTVEQSKENVALAIRTGADDYIIKPLQKQVLLNKITRVKDKAEIANRAA